MAVNRRGSGEDGQLGMGDWEEKDWVYSIRSLESKNVVAVVAGSRNSLAICENGNVCRYASIFPFFFPPEGGDPSFLIMFVLFLFCSWFFLDKRSYILGDGTRGARWDILPIRRPRAFPASSNPSPVSKSSRYELPMCASLGIHCLVYFFN